MEHKELLKVPWDWQIGKGFAFLKMLCFVNLKDVFEGRRGREWATNHESVQNAGDKGK